MLKQAPVSPADTWAGLLVSGGLTAIASGVLAGLVAYLTVRWTQGGDRAVARLVVSQQAALDMQRATKKAADETMAHLVTSNPIGAMNSHSAWIQELPFHVPVIIDEHLVATLKRYEGIVLELNAELWKVHNAPGGFVRGRFGDRSPDSALIRWCEEAGDLVDLQRQHLNHVLVAHRADKPLTASEPPWALPAMPIVTPDPPA